MSADEVWSLTAYIPAPVVSDFYLPLRDLRVVPEAATVTEWIEQAEHVHDAINVDAEDDLLPDERIPHHYGTDMTGWWQLREILDDLRNERVLI